MMRTDARSMDPGELPPFEHLEAAASAQLLQLATWGSVGHTHHSRLHRQATALPGAWEAVALPWPAVDEAGAAGGYLASTPLICQGAAAWGWPAASCAS